MIETCNDYNECVKTNLPVTNDPPFNQ
jgi:hypothetical protein